MPRVGRTVRRPGLVLLVGFLMGIGAMLGGCAEPAPPLTADHRIGPGPIYVFEPDAQDFLAEPHPLALDPETSASEALARLGDHLSRTYFNRHPDGPPGIRFEVLGVHRVEVPHRAYRLAVVNMVDPQLEALRFFFQGSAGGQTTFFMLAAAFLQPQHAPPLADGLILLYNGEEFPVIDHVDFRGIVTSEAVRPIVTKALQRYRRDSPTASG